LKGKSKVNLKDLRKICEFPVPSITIDERVLFARAVAALCYRDAVERVLNNRRAKKISNCCGDALAGIANDILAHARTIERGEKKGNKK
jgi:hypothetical protein